MKDRRPPRGRGPRRARGADALPHGVTILREDDDLIVVDKPPGLLTANAPGERRESLFDALKDLARSRGGRTARVYIVHRLDKEASGLLVFAKTEAAFHWLKQDFKTRRVHRLYLAVVEGEVRDESGGLPSGTIQTYMIDEDEEGLARSVPLGDVAREGRRARASRPSGKPRFPTRGPGGPEEPRLAVTHYRALATGQGRSLLQLRLETGRKNQIRVHMKEWGHPIVGDERYGATTNPIGRLALHAMELGFTVPASGGTTRFHSPAPDAFYAAVGAGPPLRPGQHAVPATPAARESMRSPAAETSWDEVAPWYDRLIGEGRSDLYEQVVAPGVLRLLMPREGMRVLDVACGQGDLGARLAAMGVQSTGVDASPRLIEAGRARHGTAVRLEVGDATALDDPRLGFVEGSFDAATCVMALMNINPVEAVLRGVARALKPGGAFVGVILHPAFRSPVQTSWGWDHGEEAKRPATAGGRRDEETRRGTSRGARALRRGVGRQYRRVEGYLSPAQFPIVMNPGGVARGDRAVTTVTFHRPIQSYARALSDAGFVIDTLEEWSSPRTSQPGPRAAEENRARTEIPMFLGFRALRRMS